MITLILILIFRFGCVIPVPGIDIGVVRPFSALHTLLFSLLTIFFCFVYGRFVANTDDMAEQIRERGGSVAVGTAYPRHSFLTPKKTKHLMR